jgi:hypothetical protein
MCCSILYVVVRDSKFWTGISHSSNYNPTFWTRVLYPKVIQTAIPYIDLRFYILWTTISHYELEFHILRRSNLQPYILNWDFMFSKLWSHILNKGFMSWGNLNYNPQFWTMISPPEVIWTMNLYFEPGYHLYFLLGNLLFRSMFLIESFDCSNLLAWEPIYKNLEIIHDI